jgi:hypothetical protein
MGETWGVDEWMWLGPNSAAIPLPAAVAERQPIAGSFVQETMSTPVGAKDAFTRIVPGASSDEHFGDRSCRSSTPSFVAYMSKSLALIAPRK